MKYIFVFACRAILPAWGAGPYLPALVLERPIFVREVSDGLYTAFTYLTYKVSCSSCSSTSAPFSIRVSATFTNYVFVLLFNTCMTWSKDNLYIETSYSPTSSSQLQLLKTEAIFFSGIVSSTCQDVHHDKEHKG